MPKTFGDLFASVIALVGLVLVAAMIIAFAGWWSIAIFLFVGLTVLSVAYGDRQLPWIND